MQRMVRRSGRLAKGQEKNQATSDGKKFVLDCCDTMIAHDAQSFDDEKIDSLILDIHVLGAHMKQRQAWIVVVATPVESEGEFVPAAAAAAAAAPFLVCLRECRWSE